MQMPENNRDRENEALEAPPELVSTLKRLPKAPIFIPPTVDEDILLAARRQLSRHKELLVVGADVRTPKSVGAALRSSGSVGADVRRREFKPSSPHSAPTQGLLASAPTILKRLFSWPGVVKWAAAAATVVLLLVTLPQLLRKPAAPSGVGLAGDLNRNGQVDILDAFALARQLKAGTHPGANWDVNGDGVVDERDVAALAARAVSLGKGGRS